MSAKSSINTIGGNASDASSGNTVRAPPSATGRPPTSLMFSRGNLVSGRLGSEKAAFARPSTAVRAVGYAANSGSAGQRFDQAFVERAKQQTLSSANAAVDTTKEVNPQIQYKNLEAKIVNLLESSIVLAAKGAAQSTDDSTHTHTTTGIGEVKSVLADALNKAKEAFSLDRTLHRFRDQHGENIFHNFELTYAVFFNLAEQYENNGMYIEALNTYNIMTKNKMFPHVNQLKLNMGNIYYKMGVFPKAIKMYRMALDSVPNNLKQLRLQITQNIGILFVRMGQYADAASSFEFIMSERADIRSGIHLILCYYVGGDVDKIKSTFRNLCDVQPMEAENDLENEDNFIKLQQHAAIEQQALQEQQEQLLKEQMPTNVIGAGAGAGARGGVGVDNGNIGSVNTSQAQGESITNRIKAEASTVNTDKNNYVFQALKYDELAIYTKQRKNNEKRSITMIVDLISPIIEENYNDGYNWCIEVIKSSNLSWLANELELNKALVYLRLNDVNLAIETLQMYDRKSDGTMTANALINLTFIYINLGNLDMASHCINQLNENALRTNVMALVNSSVIDFYKQNYRAAREKLDRALQIQPDSFEANYNLGLVALKEHDTQLAEEQFEHQRAQLLIPHSVQHSHVAYQLAKLQESRQMVTGSANQHFIATPASLQSYLQVLGISATEIDSKLFEKVGVIYEQMQDHQEANQYYNEAYRINPSDIEIASSIGSYYIKLQATEKAIYYYERAVLANPNDPNLMLRIASCFRNSYLPPKQYLGMYEKIYSRFPDNLNCVRALVQTAKSLGMTEMHEKYSLEYARLQKYQAERRNQQIHQQQRLSSAASRRGSSRLRALPSYTDEYIPKPIAEFENITSAVTANFNGEKYVRETEPSFTGQLHTDPLGPPAERPRTGMVSTAMSQDSDDEEMNADSLLPI